MRTRLTLAVLAACLSSCVSSSSDRSCPTGRTPFSPHYDPLTMPQAELAGGPITVLASLRLHSLLAVDLPRQTVLLRAWFTLEWLDPRLGWNLSHRPVHTSTLQPDSVWVPEVIVFNTLGSLDELVRTGRGVVVRHDGTVTWWPGGILHIFCSMDIGYFPLDVHHCAVELTTWIYDRYQVNLTMADPPFILDADYSGGEWSLATGTVGVTSTSPRYLKLDFHFRLKRKAVLHVVNSLVPLFLVSVLGGMVVRLPGGTGEKVTVCVTTFLAFLTYLRATVDSLPRNSDTLCYFSLYLTLQLLNSVLTVALAAAAEWLTWTERQRQRYIPGGDKHSGSSPRGGASSSSPDLQHCGGGRIVDTNLDSSGGDGGVFFCSAAIIRDRASSAATATGDELCANSLGSGRDEERCSTLRFQHHDSSSRQTCGEFCGQASSSRMKMTGDREDTPVRTSAVFSTRVERLGKQLTLVLTVVINLSFFLLLLVKHVQDV